MPNLCSIEGCERPWWSRAWCRRHYDMARKRGTLNEGPLIVRPPRESAPKTTCTVEGCERQAWARGWCNMHYGRWCATGDVGPASPLDRPRGENHGNWAGDRVTYWGAHLRIYRARGRADQLSCVDCDQPAATWAYDYNDPNELTDDKTGCAYSDDPAHYEPKCRSCHKKADFVVAKARKAAS